MVQTLLVIALVKHLIESKLRRLGCLAFPSRVAVLKVWVKLWTLEIYGTYLTFRAWDTIASREHKWWYVKGTSRLIKYLYFDWH